MTARTKSLFFCLLLFISLSGMAQVRTITGKVIDEEGLPLIGVTVLIEGTTTGTTTDLDGNYTLQASPDHNLRFRYIGFDDVIISVGDRTVINVRMEMSYTALEEIVVIGYGYVQRESVVGAISQAKGEDLLRTGGVTNLSNAITGLLPGVLTIHSTGQPGAEDATILIRGQTTWNNSAPLILVDGVERNMNDIDPTEVASISVLKDASATAVFGVKGANGVILVTTHRGSRHQAPVLNFSTNTTIKTLSRLPNFLGSYDALRMRNRAIETELNTNEIYWDLFTPDEILEYYRTQEMPYLFPDVDWQSYGVKDYALSNRVNMNVRGGTDLVRYFGSLSYIYEGDILGTKDYGQGYNPEFSYDRYNFRSNLDFNLTRSTVFSVDLSGHYATRKEPAGTTSLYWKALYQMPPNLFPVQYEDGTFASSNRWERYPNPIAALNMYGYRRSNSTQLLSDFTLDQKLDAITEGLSLNARFSYDNIYRSSGVNVNDEGVVYKYIVPELMINAQTAADSLAAIEWGYPDSYGTDRNQFDFVPRPFEVSPESMGNNFFQNLFYQVSLNYNRKFGPHAVSGLALMNREKNFVGSAFPGYREDWVGRATYNYDQRYFFETNAAYNGSEKFGREFRFGFFPSVALGWTVSNEQFFDVMPDYFNQLRFRYSNGKVGSDAGIERWLYVGGWIRNTAGASRYPFGYPLLQRIDYVMQEGTIANPDIHWEVSHKRNIGMETSFFDYRLSFNFDYFWENRDDIFMSAAQRNIPAWFGANPVAGNIGSTESSGWEAELRLTQQTSKDLTYWFVGSYSHVKDKVLYREDPELTPDYMKNAGFPIGQTRTQLIAGWMHNWDDIYTSTLGENNAFVVPGEYHLIDYNADGIVNSFDRVPYGFPGRPQFSFNFSTGLEYKGIRASLQFYGVHNSSVSIVLNEFAGDMALARPFHMTDSWTPQTAHTATYPALRIGGSGTGKGEYWINDGSYIRLKTAELSYDLEGRFIDRFGMNKMRIFVNGNNLWLWSKMLEDKEGGDLDREYPMVKRYNFGVNITF
jgi:TonB-linked SusC/RagA family outer membrane protein